jgi:hypothetical protein
MLQNQFADGVGVIAPDRVNHSAGEDEARPVRQTVTSGERELRVGQPGGAGLYILRVMFLKLRHRDRVALPDGVEQVFGLVFELIEVGTDWKVTIGHDGPPSW